MKEKMDLPDGSPPLIKPADPASARFVSGQEARYRALFETTPDGILIVDENGFYVDVNKSFCRILRAPRSRLIGASFAEFIPPDRLEEAKSAFGDLRTTGVYRTDFPLRALDGTIVELEWSARAHFVPGLHFCVARDITERKRAEAKLREAGGRLHRSEERLQLAAGFAHLVVWEWDIETGRIETTDNVRELYGVAAFEYADQRFAVLHPDDLERYRDTMRKVATDGESYQIEFQIIRPDTKEVVWIEERAFAVADAGGTIARVVGVVADITERKRAEAANLHFSAIVESSDDAIIGKTLDGIIQSWNKGAERLFGYSDREVIGKSITLLIPPDRIGEEDEILSRLRRGERIDHYETVRVRKDGRLLYVSLTTSPLKDRRGKIIGASKIARDITGRKEAERERDTLLARERAARLEAQEASRLKDEFLATVSHELRTPLHAILGWANLLRAGGLDPETEQVALEAIERNAKAQEHLIADLLDVSRIIAGKLRLEAQPLNLIPIIREAIDTVRQAAEAKGIVIRESLDSSIGPVVVDPDRLQQVVWNLLSNAIKFTPEEGRIEIFLERLDPHIQIRVKDNGIGISSDFLPYIFDRFRQAEGSSTRSQGGLGLGLAIVRHLAELHGGSVVAESPGEGKGSTLTVRLPIRALRSTEEPPAGGDDPLACI